MSEIHVQLEGGREAVVPAGATVAEALKAADRDAAKQALAAKVNGREVDLSVRLDDAATNGEAVRVEPVLPGTLEGLDVIRHSTAHLLAAAVLDLFPGTKLGVGPALLEDPRYGFFYERDEPLKCELIEDKGGDFVSVYYIDGSPFLDFCLGPHVPNTNRLKAFKLLSLSGAYWMGDSERPQMQRVYGTAFATQEELDAWIKQKEEAEKRDHRRLGQELDLFSFSDEIGPGLVLWHPNGALIRKVIEQFLNDKLYQSGYSFVNTPHVTQSELFRISGHLENYQEGLYPAMHTGDKGEKEDVEY